MAKCEDCKWFDVSRGLGENIPLNSEGERVCWCGYHSLEISEDIVDKEHNCINYVKIFDDFFCKCCAECTKESEGKCSDFMCRQCGTCSLKYWGTCRYSKCHDCGFCEDFDCCYQDTWSGFWDIHELELYHEWYVKD